MKSQERKIESITLIMMTSRKLRGKMAARVVAEVVAAAANEERSVTKDRMLIIARNSAWCCLTGSYLNTLHLG